MVRLSKGYEALLTPFIDSKGNFGKVYSRDMAYAASRYTEAKLAPSAPSSSVTSTRHRRLCGQLRRHHEGATSRRRRSRISLVSANTGIAVGMASNICGFNLAVCQTAIDYIADPNHNLLSTLKAPISPRAASSFTARGAQAIYERARQRQGARPLAVYPEGKPHRNLRNSVHDDR